MTKILSIQVYANTRGNAQLVAGASDLSSFSFYQKGSVSEFLSFLSQTVASRTPPNQRQSVEKDNYNAHVYSRTPLPGSPASEALTCVIVADQEYPVRVAFSLINKVLDEFGTKVSKKEVEQTVDSGGKVTSFEGLLQEYVVKYQDPKQADNILKVQQELDETKQVLHRTIEQVLERGEKLDDLVERSNNLSASSKMFYKTAKKQNSCCVIS